MVRWSTLGSLVALLLAGCAGDDELSKARYVSELNRMCEDFSAKEKEIGEPQTIADLVKKGPRVLEAFDEAILDKVRALKAPNEIAGQGQRLVRLAERQHNVLSQLIAAADANNLRRVQALAAANATVNKQASSIARDLGAEACSRDA